MSNRGAAFSCKSSPACVVLRRGFHNGAFCVGASSGVTKTRICCFTPALISMPLDCPAATLGICVSHSLTKPAVLGEPRLRGRDRKKKSVSAVLFHFPSALGEHVRPREYLILRGFTDSPVSGMRVRKGSLCVRHERLRDLPVSCAFFSFAASFCAAHGPLRVLRQHA